MFSILFIFYSIIPAIFILKVIFTKSNHDAKLIFKKLKNRFVIAIAIFTLLLLSQSAMINKSVSVNQETNRSVGINVCPELSKIELEDKSKSLSITHVNACGRVYTYLNKNAMIELRYKSNTYSYILGIGAFVAGSLTSELGGVGAIPFVYPAINYFKLNIEMKRCIELGASSAWVDEYGTGSNFMPLNCNF